MQDEISWEENKLLLGANVEVMFTTGDGRKDQATDRISGRARDNRLVHVRVPSDPADRPRPGDIGEVTITYAAPHHLVADSPIRNLRRTRGGDAWQAHQDQPDVTSRAVGLGIPALAPRSR